MNTDERIIKCAMYLPCYEVSMLNKQLSLRWENSLHDLKLLFETVLVNKLSAFLFHSKIRRKIHRFLKRDFIN